MAESKNTTLWVVLGCLGAGALLFCVAVPAGMFFFAQGAVHELEARNEAERQARYAEYVTRLGEQLEERPAELAFHPVLSPGEVGEGGAAEGAAEVSMGGEGVWVGAELFACPAAEAALVQQDGRPALEVVLSDEDAAALLVAVGELDSSLAVLVEGELAGLVADRAALGQGRLVLAREGDVLATDRVLDALQGTDWADSGGDR